MTVFLQIRNLDKVYGDHTVFEGAGVTIGAKDRVGVIGRNGAGKSTLFRLITGEETADVGEIVLHPRLRLAYLAQDDRWELGESIIAFLMRSSGRPEWDAARLAARFGIRSDLLAARISDLPGGFRTRVKLVEMLLHEPDFLLLDEPTNYLDLETLFLLERFLGDFSGGFALISHDREFLSRTCDRTLEVEQGQLTLFPGDVESYLEFKAEERGRLERENRKIDARRRHLEEFVARNRVRAATASRAQSKIKAIERLKPISIEHPIATARIRIPAVESRSGAALDCEDLAIGYPERIVARGIRLEIRRGERVAVVGNNGEGKTTFLRTLAGEIPPRDGAFRWGYGLEPGYYAQHVYASIPGDLTVLEFLERRAHPSILRQEILDMAGSFLFQGDDVDKRVEVLSGGERARLSLAALLLERRSVLLLDEPTNHLDFETVEALGNALREHAGTIFFVSHDRTFVHLVATNVVEVGSGRVTLYPDGYDAYVWRVEREADAAISTPARSAPAAESAARTRSEGRESHERRKERRARRTWLKRRLEEAEKRLEKLQKERDEIHRFWLENPTDPSPERRARLAELTGEIDAQEAAWLELGEELEGIDREERAE